MSNSSARMSTTYQGLPAAPGYAVGPIFHWRRVLLTVAAVTADPVCQLEQAFAAAQARLEAALQHADATLAPLLEAQRLMLDDPELREGALQLTREGTVPTTAVISTAERLAAMLAGAATVYFRERAIDVRAVGALVAEALCGPAARAIPAGVVVVAEELGPWDTARFAEAGVAALVTRQGGPTCHAAIIARAWGIPAMVGAPPEIFTLPEATPVSLDGQRGVLTTYPTAATAAALPVAPSAVRLTRRVPVYANIGSLAEAQRARAWGAEGIGLLRTEFLFHDRATAPSEEEQVAQYTAILQCLEGRPVVIRTLDIGADKPAPYLSMPAEANPQLGLRGIRLCLREQTVLRTQLRALARAAAAGPLRIMLPMVTTVDEVRQTRDLLREITEELHCPPPPLGAMIEVPMAALAAPELAAVCDFFSLGTNDLLQFLLAADREHAGVGYLHAAEHPGVWRLIAPVITAAHAAGIPVSVCGEWGADPEKLARLLDLGIDSVSVAVATLPRVRGWFAE